jgi:hypothetical protein
MYVRIHDLEEPKVGQLDSWTASYQCVVSIWKITEVAEIIRVLQQWRVEEVVINLHCIRIIVVVVRKYDWCGWALQEMMKLTSNMVYYKKFVS